MDSGSTLRRPLAGVDGFWEPVRSNVVDCFVQFFDYVLPRESLAVVRVVSHCLRERLAWCDVDGTPRAPREVVTLAELDQALDLDRKSIRAALTRAVEAHYLEPVLLPDGAGAGFRIKIDLSRFTVEPSEFSGFYPLPTHRIRVPLEFFTTVVAEENLSTLKVVACIIRLTLGSIDNVGLKEITPSISQQQFVRRMNMGRRQAIQGVQSALLRGYIRRVEQGSLDSGRPSTYGLYWRSAEQALSWPEAQDGRPPVVPLAKALGKRDQAAAGKRDQAPGKKGSGTWEKGIRASGKGDQEAGKKGSGASGSIDLLKDLDLRSRSRSAASSGAPTSFSPPEGPSTAAAAAATLYEQVKAVFPLGNRALIEKHIALRGTFVGQVLGALEEVDPSFLRRFTKTADPRWAAFHTCCTQGLLPPRRPLPAPPVEARIEHGEAEGEKRWRHLAPDVQLERLIELWRKTWRVHMDAPPEPEAIADAAAALEQALGRGLLWAELEEWVLRDIARRRGRSIGPFEAT